MNPAHKKYSVSLVLGSGGARGLAHIGIIDCLTEHGLDIRSIAGTSMGALVGGIYAAGKLDLYKNWVSTLERRDVIQLLDLSFSNNGLIKGERIIKTLKDMIGNANIGELAVKFTAVATDLDEGKEVWISDGPLFDAIRASIGIPTVFTPYRYRNKLLVDGSLVNPVPVGATVDDQTDLTIAVNLNGKVSKRTDTPDTGSVTRRRQNGYQQRMANFIDDIRQYLNIRQQKTLGLFDVVARSMNIMEDTITQWQLKSHSPDIVIEIPRNTCSFYEFYRAQEIIRLGREKAGAALARAGILN